MKEHKYPLADLDGLQFHMKCATELVGLVQEVMAGDGYDSEEPYSNALFGAYCHLVDLVNEMREITDLLFAEQRNAAKLTVKGKEEGTV